MIQEAALRRGEKFSRHNIKAYLRHVDRNNQHDINSVLPFDIEGRRLGYITKELSAYFFKVYPDIFIRTDMGVALAPHMIGFDLRTAFFDELLTSLYEKGMIEKPRDEFYGIAENFGESPLFKIRRGASAYFGFKNYGIHLNAYVRRPDGLYIWVSTRSAAKAVAPHKLDQLVAGGQPYGLSVHENLLKESQEEANLLPDRLQNVIPTGVLRYCRQTDNKFRRDYIFVHDVELSDDFVPMNNDGEVASFHLKSIGEIIEHLEAPDDFKFNSALVIIDFFIRHGIITPEEPEYFKLTQRLYP